jgi:16S rRNA U516 pseudouridylate synthase RsuA-like enzyme
MFEAVGHPVLHLKRTAYGRLGGSRPPSAASEADCLRPPRIRGFGPGKIPVFTGR